MIAIFAITFKRVRSWKSKIILGLSESSTIYIFLNFLLAYFQTIYIYILLQQSTTKLIKHNFIQNLNSLFCHKGSSGGILNKQNQNYKITRAAGLSSVRCKLSKSIRVRFRDKIVVLKQHRGTRNK